LVLDICIVYIHLGDEWLSEGRKTIVFGKTTNKKEVFEGHDARELTLRIFGKRL